MASDDDDSSKGSLGYSHAFILYRSGAAWTVGATWLAHITTCWLTTLAPAWLVLAVLDRTFTYQYKFSWRSGADSALSAGWSHPKTFPSVQVFMQILSSMNSGDFLTGALCIPPQCLLDSLLPVQVLHAHLEPRGQGRLLDSCTAVSSGWNCIRHWLHSGSVANLEQRGQKRLPDGYTPLLTDWVTSVTWFTQMLLEIWRSIDSWEHTSTCLIVTSTAWLIQVLW